MYRNVETTMSILRRRGKEKLRFRIMNKKRVTTKDFKYLKRLFLECLRENRDIEKQLDLNYKHIQVCFFYEHTDPYVEKSLREFLKDPSIIHSPKSFPAFAMNRKGLGCIMVFLKHLEESAKERKDLENVRAYPRTEYLRNYVIWLNRKEIVVFIQKVMERYGIFIEVQTS